MNSFQGKALTWHYLGLLGSAGSTSFTYDTSGRRLSKTTGGTTTNYYYAGDMLVGQKTGNNELEFMFDSSGDYFGFTYNGTAYYYIKNLQGDVISIFNANGNEVATYTYDAWGRTLATTDTSGVNISAINPIRYRGYYYDTETGFYFLQTRYYAPEICRFLSADTYVSTGQGILGYNMFAYCLNNPINNKDFSGKIAIKVALVILLIGGIIGGILGYCHDEKLFDVAVNNKKDNENNSITDNNNTNQDEPLSTVDRVVNTAIGFTLGVATSGGAIALLGAGATVVKSVTFVVPVFEATGPQLFAIGALAYNFFAMFVAPMFGIELEPIEYTS